MTDTTGLLKIVVMVLGTSFHISCGSRNNPRLKKIEKPAMLCSLLPKLGADAIMFAPIPITVDAMPYRTAPATGLGIAAINPPTGPINAKTIKTTEAAIIKLLAATRVNITIPRFSP